MATLATLVVKLTGDISEFQGAMDAAQTKFQNVGRNVTNTGVALTKGITLPIVGAGAAVTHFANNFNSDMANVASLGEESADRVAGWKPMIQDLAIEVGKGTGDMADGLYNVVSAFGATDDSFQILEINARAATGGLASTSEAIALTSAVTKAYGDTTAGAVGNVADLALRTVQLGQTTFPELAGSIGTVTPLTAGLGVSMEELFGVMATGTGVTGGAGQVATQLRGILQSLMAPTGDMAGLMADMGFETGQAMIEGLGLQGTIDAIVQSAEDTGRPLQAYIGSIEGQTLAMALAGPQADTFTEKLAAMETAAGAADEAFEAQTQGVNANGFAMEQARVKMEVMAQRLGDGLAPAVTQILALLEPFIDWLVGLANQFAQMDPQMQLTIAAVLGIAAAIGPLLVVVGTLITAIGTIAGAFSAVAGVVGTVITFLTGPLGLAILAVVAVLGVLFLAWQNNWGGIQEKTQLAIDFVKGVISAGLQFISDWWAAHGESVMVIVNAIWTGIQNAFTAATTFISELIATVTAFIAGVWEEHGETFQTIIDNAWVAVQGIVSLAGEVLGGIIDAIASAIEGDWEAFGENLRVAWDALWAAIQLALETAKENLLLAVGILVEEVVAFFVDTDWEQIGKDIIDGIKNGVKNAASSLANAAVSAARAALNAVKGFLGAQSPSRAFMNVGNDIGAGLVIGINETQRMVDLAAKQLAEKVISPFVDPGVGFGDLPAPAVARGSVDLPGAGARYGKRPIVIHGDLHLHGIEDSDSLLAELEQLAL